LYEEEVHFDYPATRFASVIYDHRDQTASRFSTPVKVIVFVFLAVSMK